MRGSILGFPYGFSEHAPIGCPPLAQVLSAGLYPWRIVARRGFVSYLLSLPRDNACRGVSRGVARRNLT